MPPPARLACNISGCGFATTTTRNLEFHRHRAHKSSSVTPPSFALSPTADAPDTLELRLLAASSSNDSNVAIDAIFRVAENGFIEDIRRCAYLCRATRREEGFWSRVVTVGCGKLGRTHLMLAAHRNDIARIDWLIERGAPVHAVDADGWNALFYATGPESFNALLAQGANAESVDFDMRTPIMEAAEENDAARVRWLLDCGVPSDALDSNRCNELFFARSAEVVEVLLAEGVDFLHCDSAGYHAVEHAIRNGCVDVVRAMCDIIAKPSPLLSDEDNDTLERDRKEILDMALETASAVGSAPAARILLAAGAEPTASILGNTASAAVVHAFFDAGVDPEITEDGKSAFEIAATAEHVYEDVVKALLAGPMRGRKRAKSKPSELRLVFGSLENVRALLSAGIDPNVFTSGGAPFLYTCINEPENTTEEKRETLRLLVKHGVDINARDEYGSTPLIWAVTNENTEVALALIKLGADVNLVDADKQTALHCAVLFDSVDVVRALRLVGAKSFKDKDGKLPEDYSTARGSAMETALWTVQNHFRGGAQRGGAGATGGRR